MDPERGKDSTDRGSECQQLIDSVDLQPLKHKVIGIQP